jgi:alpha-beta hydrolase superfamily lysophospholipase
MRASTGAFGAICVAAAAILAVGESVGCQESAATLTIRGKSVSLHVYGNRGNPPVIVSSGDGGWVHLGPRVARLLASRGFFVVGVDAKAYLSRFTSSNSVLSMADVQADYQAFVDFARAGGEEPVILAGVSEGAGLSVLAATSPAVRQKVRGVVAMGLPDIAELGWRWRDNLIYFTHKAPDEPSFSTAAVIDGVSPVPLAAIHSRRDEFVPVETLQAMMAKAKEPKRTWIIEASDHGFSDKQTEFDAVLMEAIGWVRAQKP